MGGIKSMMKYFKLNNEVFAFEADGSQDAYITEDMVKMTDEEIDKHVNPEKYFTEEQKYAIKIASFPTLSPAQFELRLLKAGLRQQVLDYVATSEELQIVFNRATYFSRTDPFLLEAMQALNLSDAQVDALWVDEV